MTATQHPDHNGRGLPIFHEDGSTNQEALASLAILAADQDLVLVRRSDLWHLLKTIAADTTTASPDACSAIASAAVIASNPVAMSLI